MRRQAALGAEVVKNGLGQTMKLKWLGIDKATKKVFRQEPFDKVCIYAWLYFALPEYVTAGISLSCSYGRISL